MGITSFVVLSVLLLYSISLIKSNDKNIRDNYFYNFNIISKGVVIAIDSLDRTFHKSGLICLKIINSNYKVYDQRDSLKEYYLLQIDSLIVFYDSGDLTGTYFYEIGDIVEINGKKRSLKCFNQSGLLKFQKKLILKESFFCPYNQFSTFLDECKNNYHHNLPKLQRLLIDN